MDPLKSCLLFLLLAMISGPWGCGPESREPDETSPVHVLTDRNFDEATAQGVVLVEFWRPM